MNGAKTIDPEYMTARALATYSGLGVRDAGEAQTGNQRATSEGDPEKPRL